MRSRAWRATLPTATIIVGALCLGAARPVHAFTMDARRLGMGSVVSPGGSDLATANVAYTVVPGRDDGHGWVIPLPLGLAQLAADFPTLDSSNPNFDVLRVADLILNPPFFLELSQPSPLDGDISIAIARNQMSINFADAQQLLPQEPIHTGAVWSRPLVGLGIKGARTSLAPLFQAEGRVGFDDALYGVLAGGQPLLPNSSYGFHAAASTLAGTAFNAGWAGGGWGKQDGSGLYLGAYAKYIFGFGFGLADTRVALATADTIFGDQDPLNIDYEGWTRYSRGVGNGYGLDLGAAYRTGAFDFGLGLRDIGTQIHWGSSQYEHSYLDDVSGAVVTETLESGAHFVQRLPVQTTANVSWSGRSTVLAADVTASRWGTFTHMGVERRVSMVALRGGLLTDERQHMQYACGFGLGLKSVWFDIGLQSHGFALTEQRGWTLGTSFAIR